MNYSEATQWLFDQLPMYQQKGAVALNAKLDGITYFCAYLGEPHQKFKSIHVAGTNGKGSSSHMLAAILQEAGYKVGLYTSPHLKDFRERIKINGHEISEDEVVSFVLNHKDYMSQNALSFFEMTVAMAFDFFASARVDIAIIEVGLGGRLDATNIIKPEVSLITNIGFDHMDLLGNTLAQIAIEKAGIIKPSIPVVISEWHRDTEAAFKAKSAAVGAPIYFASDLIEKQYLTDLKGAYQEKNTKGVVAALRHLSGFNVTSNHIKMGLSNVVGLTGLLGRWQVLQHKPLVIADTAHNEAGISIVVKQLLKTPHKRLHMVLGFVKDKDLNTILPLLPVDALYYIAAPAIQRGLDPLVFIEQAKRYNLFCNHYESVNEAFKAAKKQAKKEDLVFIGGSNFVVAEVV
ncbi:bifunctional folylpolyglutamate synthase/dihydrofolate synthase [Flavobacteriaceae bacterium]|nr:bifunctional folylpolyglutamate synthase/dihydrofolate synthase [Flavobacteriaceae bacterium]